VILDSSALVAIVRREPGFERLVEKLDGAAGAGIGTPTLVEAGLVIEVRLNVDSRGVIERFMGDFDVARIPFGEEHWREAVSAFRRFGKGRHAAGLNFGDCMTYAVARLAGQPLLYVGDDFARTDLDAA
jgi:ribonuclease VapC